MARKRGGIKIVWLAWFTDSIALWRRQDEKPYLLDDLPMPGPSSSPIAESQLISSDIDLDSDDWDQDPPEPKDAGELDFAAVNWDEINDEVEAFMNETDDDEGEQSDGLQSGNISEEEWASDNG
jgi:RNA polymerase II subunit A-like phosphatase